MHLRLMCLFLIEFNCHPDIVRAINLNICAAVQTRVGGQFASPQNWAKQREEFLYVWERPLVLTQLCNIWTWL